MFKYSNTNKRYHTYDYYLKQKYGSKVFKVSLNAGFTCPNRDGNKGTSGCAFCSTFGGGENGGNVKENLNTQFENIKKIMQLKWPNGKCIAYFQAFSNTYKPVEELEKMGADITVEGNRATINGVARLKAAEVSATDLRAGAALIIAGLTAEGETKVAGVEKIERGYDDIVGKLKSLGADVELIEE